MTEFARAAGRRLSALALPLFLCAAGFGGNAAGEDLVAVYRDALVADPAFGAARSTWVASQEALPQARAGLLPVLSVLGVANEQDFNESLHTDLQPNRFHQRFGAAGYTVSASQPLYRAQNWISFDQATPRRHCRPSRRQNHD